MHKVILESILDDYEGANDTAASQVAVQMNERQIDYKQWYAEVSNGDYEQMYCVSHHFMGPEYVQDLEEFREDLVHMIERYFRDKYSMQIVASIDKYENLGIQKEPGKRDGGPLLNEPDFTGNQVRFKFAVEFPGAGAKKVFTFLDFAASVYRLIRRPTSGKKVKSRKNGIMDQGRLEIYPFVNEETGYIWPGGANEDCIILSSAYEYRYLKKTDYGTKRDVMTYAFQMYLIDLCREQEEHPFEEIDYKNICEQWIDKRSNIH